jgi:hypothetical protein
MMHETRDDSFDVVLVNRHKMFEFTSSSYYKTSDGLWQIGNDALEVASGMNLLKKN